MNKKGVMERVSWYQELRKIFSTNSEHNMILKAKLLQCLTDNISRFPLKNPQEYYNSNSVQGFSFEDVYLQIESMPRAIKWDEILDSFAYLSIYTRGFESSGTISPVQAKSEKQLDENKSPSKGTLKEDFPLVKFYNLSEIAMNQSLKFLSLGGNLISSASYEFPSSLIALNLSYNIISDFQPAKPLSNLKFLNLSHNLIENLPDITSIITLNELHISNNKLNVANFLFSIKNLTILDLSFNLIENFEDLAMLSVSSKLSALSLLNNPLYNKSGYLITIKELFSRLLYTDHQDMASLSNYKQFGFSSEPKRSPEKTEASSLMKSDPNFSIFSSFHGQNSIMSTDNQSKTTKNAPNRSGSIENRLASGCPGTPKNIKYSSSKHMRSRSNGPGGSLPTTPSLNNSCLNTSHKKHNTMIPKNNSSKQRLKVFGDPYTIMLVGPPAVKSIFRSQGNNKNNSIDISKFKYMKTRKSP